METMKRASAIRRFVVSLAVVGMCLPSVAFAASPEAPVVTDVKLQEGVVLVGFAVDDQGAPMAGIPVSLRSNGQELAVGVTNPDGIFAFRGVHQGIYQVASGKSVGTFRVWTVETAPPAAQQAALVVVTDGVVRGQSRMGSILTNPLVIGAGIATAIAVPVAVANHNRHSSSN
jgi:hypothetical protein